MKTIYKYELEAKGMQEIVVPLGTKILHADNQHETICVWCEVDTEKEQSSRMIEVFGTGHKMSFDMGIEREYIGTVKLQGGDFVFHVYERIN